MPLSIDHIVIAVTDLDAAIRDYTALGFTVLPGGEHPRGSRNALVVFEDGAYLEIIAFPRPVADFRWWQVLDRSGPGLVDYAVLPDDLDADLARARAAGIVMDGPLDGGRLQPDGTRIAWRSARPPEPDIPFLCTDVTTRSLRVPEGAARRHANGVTGVAGVTVAVQNLATSVARYPPQRGPAPVALGGGARRGGAGQRGGGVDLDDAGEARLGVRAHALLRVPRRDRDDVHAGHGVDDLVHQAAAHEPGADQGDPDRAAVGLARLQQRVDDDHGATSAASASPASTSGHARSLSEIAVTGTGHSMPNAASSYRKPCSPSGAYGPLTW